MKPNPTALFLVSILALLSHSVLGKGVTPQDERLAASYLLVFGRMASPAEIQHTAAQAPGDVMAWVSQLRQQLQRDPQSQRDVAVKAFRDTYGREPRPNEIAGDGDYTELVNKYLLNLAQTPDEYKQVLDRAYRLVARRPLYAEEVEYWKPYGTLPFAFVVSSLDEWARRNQPGLMVTTGTAASSVNCHYLVTARLSPAVAEEARIAIGLPAAAASDYSHASNRTIIAAGAANIVSNGRIHFAAAGAPDLVPAGVN